MRKITFFILTIALLAALPAYAQQPTPEQTQQPLPVALAPELMDSGAAAFDAQDYDTALVDFSLFILLNPTFSQGYYLRALSHLGREDTDSALSDLQQALALMPENPEYGAVLYQLRADIYSDLERYDDALADYSEAIDLFPSAELYFRRAQLYGFIADFDNALTDLNAALVEAPDDPVLLVYRASINLELGNDEEAPPDYYRFLQVIEAQRVEHEPLVDSEPQYVFINQGVIHQFEIEGEREQVISIVAQGRPGDNIDPLMVLLDDGGGVLAANDDYEGRIDAVILDFQLPSNGTYTLLVSHSLGGFQGEVVVAYQVTK
jgi:tetratricopeptide (TPR) repeat protein